jgi:hypothetical protein
MAIITSNLRGEIRITNAKNQCMRFLIGSTKAITIYFNCKVKLAQSVVNEVPRHENDGRTVGLATPFLNFIPGERVSGS